MRRNHSSLALCLASSAVLLIPVKVTEAEPGLFILLADPQGSTVVFSIVTFGLLKESGQPCEPRGKTSIGEKK